MQRRIRILHIAQAAGGVERYLQLLMKYLDQECFENILVCSQDYCITGFKENVFQIEQIEMQRAIGFSDIKATLLVRKIIKQYKPDIVYAHSSKAGAIARVANVGLWNKCIYNPHGWAFKMKVSKKKQAVYTWLERIMALFCDKIVCISDAESQSALEKRICKVDKLKVIFNGVDMGAYESAEHGLVKRSDLGIPEDAFVVGMVGRLSPQKAPDIFIRMAKLVKDSVESAHFIIVGNGEQWEEVLEYARKNRFVGSVHITQWVNNPMDYIELFDVACLLSRWEGFGLVIPEYMMAGKPVVATEVDAIPNLIQHGTNGLLVEVDNAEAASEAVLRLKNDVKLRNQLIVQGYKDVREKYDAKRVSEQHDGLFKEMYFGGISYDCN